MMEDKDLAAVLQAARKGGEISYEKLSAQCGGKPTAKRLHQLANAPLRNFPDPDTITHLARGTGQSITTIVMASARSLGLNVTSDDPDTVRLAGSSNYPPALLDAFRTLGEQITTALAEERDGSGNAAPITHAGESPATHQEPRERSAESSSLAEVLSVSESSQHPDADTDDDELARRRRERDEQAASSGRGATSDQEQVEIPMPDEDRMAGYDAPSEGRAMREQQDEDAEGPQE
ncbi:hypothetical protein ACH9EU_12805 [Kocuria sp. M1R5S2]|uniref:hypothetical protein n=1 Tax=Kocuria rhizosphaerae TaxID=3376285 RepID=UPI0037A29C21